MCELLLHIGWIILEQAWSQQYVLAAELIWPLCELHLKTVIFYTFLPTGQRSSLGRQSAMMTLAMSKLASSITWVSTSVPHKPIPLDRLHLERTIASVWRGIHHHMAPLHHCWLCSTRPVTDWLFSHVNGGYVCLGALHSMLGAMDNRVSEEVSGSMRLDTGRLELIWIEWFVYALLSGHVALWW